MKTRLTNLDVIKAVAAVFIVFHHYQQIFDVRFSGINFFGGSFYWGRMVELFFVISGFVMVTSDDPEDYHVVRSFLKKCARIYPPVMLSVTVLLLLQGAHSLVYGDMMFAKTYSLGQIITSYLLIFNGFGFHVGLGVNNPTWYLCVLLLCYVVYYTIKIVFRERNRWKIALYLLITGIAGFAVCFPLMDMDQIPFMEWGNLRGYCCFFMGVLIAVFQNELRNKRFGAVAGAAAIVIWLTATVSGIIGVDYWPTLVILLFGGMVMLATSIKQIPYQAIQKAGGVSYEVFLWHVPTFYAVQFVSEILEIEFRHSYCSMIIVTILVECVAVCIYTCFEIPITRYLKMKALTQRNKKL